MVMVTAVAAIAPLSVLGVMLTATSWWEGLTMAVGFLLRSSARCTPGGTPPCRSIIPGSWADKR